MPTPYRILSDDTLNLLAERGNAQALMELGYRAERLAILAEVQELANRLREEGERDVWNRPVPKCPDCGASGPYPCPCQELPEKEDA